MLPPVQTTNNRLSLKLLPKNDPEVSPILAKKGLLDQGTVYLLEHISRKDQDTLVSLNTIKLHLNSCEIGAAQQWLHRLA